MKKLTAMTVFAATGTAFVSGAQADIVASDPVILAPFDNAVAEIVWIKSKAGYTGELSWMGFNQEARTPISEVMIWNNKQVARDDTFDVPMVFQANDRLDFQYEIVRGGLDTFATSNENDWQQFRIDASDPTSVLVEIEDIRLPRGDADYNDVRFTVNFTQAVPAPGATALLGMGGLVIARRRR